MKNSIPAVFRLIGVVGAGGVTGVGFGFCLGVGHVAGLGAELDPELDPETRVDFGLPVSTALAGPGVGAPGPLGGSSGARPVSRKERSAEDADETYRKLAIFSRVLNYVQNNYVVEARSDQLIYGAIRGMLATLDPHSTFLEPEQFAAVRNETLGEFGGIGIEIVRRNQRFVIVEVQEGGPAETAGVRLGDVILEVDGSSTSRMSLKELVQHIKGTPDTPVTLRLERVDPRDPSIEVVSMRRERIRADSVEHRWLEDGIAYIRIRAFSERTAHGVEKALVSLRAQRRFRGLLLDIRDNPGGLLDEAVRVADFWIAQGLIVSTESRDKPPDEERAHPKGTEPRYPMICLVNGGSASASEILAGALQDHARAVVVGTQTFGKGSVQTVIELEDGSALKLTIARYYTPRHRSIQGTGIVPDIGVPVSPTPHPLRGSENPQKKHEDNQLNVAQALLKQWVESGERPEPTRRPHF